MPPTYTPLRYPGGKAKLAPYLTEVLRANRLFGCTYAEPYAGGAGAGLHLLFRGYAEHLWLNDLDRGVISFWRAVTAQAEKFAERIRKVPLTVREWDRQKEVLSNDAMGFDHGFAFFYLNRTNRSGIMNGGVIGGREQDGDWKMDARFNRSELAERVTAIGRMKARITVTHLDACDFLDRLAANVKAPALVYLDPPYYNKGQQLYPNAYAEADHRTIADKVKKLTLPWIMTYDDCPEIRKLYRQRVVLSSELSYSAREVRRGNEVVVFGPRLKRPGPASEGRRARTGFALTAE